MIEPTPAPMPWEEHVMLPETAAAAEPVAAAQPASEAEPWTAGWPEETGHAAPPWEDEITPVAPEPESEPQNTADATATAGETAGAGAGREFPLDAFIIPEDAHRIPAGTQLSPELQRQIVEDVASRLEQLAARLRQEGLGTLVAPTQDHEPVDVVLAAVISGYVSRKAH